VPAQTPHQAEALEDTFELDVFSPIRQDWVSAADQPGTEP
jgi:quercetin dioxygenase-like cupin family protein